MLTLSVLILRLLFLPPLLVMSALSTVILFAAPRWTAHLLNLSRLFNWTFFRASPFVVPTRNLRVLLTYSLSFPSLSTHARAPICHRSAQERRQILRWEFAKGIPGSCGVMPTTPPRNKHFQTQFFLLATVPRHCSILQNLHPVGTTTPTPLCLSATVLFRSTPTFRTPTTSQLSPAPLDIDPLGSGGGLSLYVKLQDPLRAQEGCLE